MMMMMMMMMLAVVMGHSVWGKWTRLKRGIEIHHDTVTPSDP